MSIIIQPKFDGVRMVVHRNHDEVRIFTEDEMRERQQVLPQVVEAVKKCVASEQVILDAEFVLYEDGKPQPREDMLELVVGKEEITEPLKVFVHDCVYDSKPINEQGYLDRIKHVHEIILHEVTRKNDILIPAVYWVATSKSEFMEALKKAYKFEGSEGSMLKWSKSKYLPGVARTADWAKIKVTQEYAGKIIGITKKAMPWGHIGKSEPKTNITGDKALKLYKRLQEDSNTYKFRLAVKSDSELIPMESKVTVTESMHKVKWNADIKEPKWQGTDDPRIWKTDKSFPPKEVGDYAYANTYNKSYKKVKPKLGMIVTAAPKKVVKWKDDEDNVHYSHMFPRLKELKPERKQPDSISDVHKINKIEKKLDN